MVQIIKAQKGHPKAKLKIVSHLTNGDILIHGLTEGQVTFMGWFNSEQIKKAMEQELKKVD